MVIALREAYAAFNRGDIDAALKPLDPQKVEGRPPSRASDATTAF